MSSIGADIRGLSTDEALRAAGLDWTLERRAVITAADHLNIPDHYALVRNTDQSVFDVVGSRYRVHQNREIFEAMAEFMRQGGAKLDMAGPLRGGRVVWCRAELGESFKLKGDDRVGGYLLALAPHESGRATMFRWLAHRGICENMFSRTIETDARFNHSSVFDPKRAIEVMMRAREGFVEFQRNARVLQSLNLSFDDVLRILAPVYQPYLGNLEPEQLAVEVEALVREPEGAGPAMRQVLQAYKSAPGARVGTGWGVLNAVTYHSDHQAGRNADARLTSAWIGTEATRKQRILDRLLEMAS